MKPRSSRVTPLSAASRSVVTGRRPTATISLSKVSFCSPWASVKLTVTCFFFTSEPVTRAPRRMFRPCLVRIFRASLETCSSAAGRNLSRASMTVTSAPRRAQTEPSSRPITPAPITPSFFGTAWKSRAPVESTITSWSTGAGGMSTGLEPEARITFSASTICTLPSEPVTSTCLLASSLPWPSSRVTPLALNRVATPPVRFFTMVSLRPTMVGTSMETPLASMPWTLKASWASWYL
ncbi:hypothetical protein D9M71_484870 [compost metagenome]